MWVIQSRRSDSIQRDQLIMGALVDIGAKP